MDRILIDLRYAVRVLARSPGFTMASVLVLALGIGASTAVFSVVDNILFRPLDLPAADRVIAICETHPSLENCASATPTLLDFDARSRSFEAMGAARSWPYFLGTEDGGRPISVGFAVHRYFEALGLEAARGRLIRPADSPPDGSGRVAVVRHGFWQRELGGAPDVLGRTILLDDEPYRIVGVLPPDAFIPRLDWLEVWIPLPWDPTRAEDRNWRGFGTVARLGAGVDENAAEAELEAIRSGLAEAYPEDLRGWGVEIMHMRDLLVGDTRPVLLIFLGAVGAVLLIVCVNMASLLLTRATAREKELAVRSALGAGRGTLAAQLLAESTVLALLGGLGGAVVAFWATDLFLFLAPPGVPRIEEVVVDGRILGFTLAVSATTGFLFGLVPAARARRVEISQVLRGGRSPGSGQMARRTRRLLVVGQLALAVMLVTGAGLLYRGFSGLLEWDPGFETENLITFSVFFPPGPERPAWFRQVEEGIRAVPGVTSVGMVSAGPLFGGGDGQVSYFIEDADWTLAEAPSVAWFDAGPGYFETLGVEVVGGRTFSEADGPEAAMAVAVVNETFARRHWPDGSPLGQQVRLAELEATVEVIGVVRDVPPFDPTAPPSPELYLSNRQTLRGFPYVVVRTAIEPGAVVEPVRAAVESVHPDLDPSQVRTMEELVANQLVRPRFNALLVGLFAGVALLLGAVGIYGVVAYGVELQRHEIGVRMALGAGRARVVARVLGDGLRLLVVGVILGAGATLATGGLLTGLLYGVPPTDPWTFAATVAVLLLVGSAATLIPALRASRTDPQDALRVD